MNILATQYSLNHKAFEIYVSGCYGNPHCTNCHNPQSWNFNNGDKYTYNYFTNIKIKINEFNNLIDNIFIMGGEPLDQSIDELIYFLTDLKSLNKNIWLFTRYDFEDIPKEVLKLCDYIKTGQYIEELKTDDNISYGIKLATKNQKIHKINN